VFDKSEGDIVIGNMPLLNENVYVKGSVKSYVSLTQAAWLDIRAHYSLRTRISCRSTLGGRFQICCRSGVAGRSFDVNALGQAPPRV